MPAYSCKLGIPQLHFPKELLMATLLSPEKLDAIMERKNKMRREAYDRRNAQENKDGTSARACEQFVALPEYQNAKVAMWYIDCRSETRTKPELLEEVKKGEKKIIVPYCTVNEAGENKLGLWYMESLEEMVIGKWDILEPPKEHWGESGKEVEDWEVYFQDE